MFRIFLLSACLAVLSIPAWGQALPVVGAGVWQVGAGFSFGPPDYTLPYIKGGSFYASYDINEHSGMIAEIHIMNWFGPKYVGESSFLVGGRYGHTWNRLHPYIKILIGIGLFQPKPALKPSPGSAGYEAFAAGMGLEYRLSEHLALQVGDFEYQGWPAFQKDGLTPWIETSGVSYRF